MCPVPGNAGIESRLRCWALNRGALKGAQNAGFSPAKQQVHVMHPCVFFRAGTEAADTEIAPRNILRVQRFSCTTVHPGWAPQLCECWLRRAQWSVVQCSHIYHKPHLDHLLWQLRRLSGGGPSCRPVGLSASTQMSAEHWPSPPRNWYAEWRLNNDLQWH